MLYDVAVVRDAGDRYIVDYTFRHDLTLLDSSLMYLRISAMCAEAINDAKSKGYPVYIPKGIEGEVLSAQIIVEEADELTTAKNLACYKVYSMANSALTSLSFIDIYGFLSQFANFASKGIFITDENVEKVKALYTLDESTLVNRDEAYINIIRKRNEEDLNNLQTFIEANDKCKEVYLKYKKSRIVISQIEAATTAQEAETLANGYLAYVSFLGN